MDVNVVKLCSSNIHNGDRVPAVEMFAYLCVNPIQQELPEEWAKTDRRLSAQYV